MAVDAHHLLLSSPQLFPNNRDLIVMNSNNNMAPTNGGFSTNIQNGYGEDSTPPPPPLLYGGSSPADDSFTYYPDGAYNHLLTRKRSRDSRSDYYHHLSPSPFAFLGQDIDLSSHINQQQLDIDRFVSLHMERVRFEIEERRRRQARTIVEAIEHGLAKRLRVKEEERERIGKMNHALEERVKSLTIENQIWRDLAQSNEATANNLRNNLEQVLAQVNDLTTGAGLDNDDNDDDAQSFCGSSSSSSGEETVRRRREEVGNGGGRMCRNCGEGESCVLVLPCRHLCLCGVCGSSVHTCPICRSPKNASVHVNMSP